MRRGILDAIALATAHDPKSRYLRSRRDARRHRSRFMARHQSRPHLLRAQRSIHRSGARLCRPWRAQAHRAGLRGDGRPSQCSRCRASLSRSSSPITAQTSPWSSAPFPGCVALLDRLRPEGIGLGICTNKLEGLSVKLIDALGLSAYFDAIVGTRYDRHRQARSRSLSRDAAPHGGRDGALASGRRQRDRRAHRARRRRPHYRGHLRLYGRAR